MADTYVGPFCYVNVGADGAVVATDAAAAALNASNIAFCFLAVANA